MASPEHDDTADRGRASLGVANIGYPAVVHRLRVHMMWGDAVIEHDNFHKEASNDTFSGPLDRNTLARLSKTDSGR